MRQAVLTQPGVIEFFEVDQPGNLKEDEILLKIQKIGVCGTDIHVYHGKHPFVSYPLIQGHEFSAIVEAVGNCVTKVRPGDRATARPQIVCGICAQCLKGDYNICDKLKVQGFQAAGVAQDYFITNEERIVLFPESMTFDQGALIEPAAVGAHSTLKAKEIKNKNIVVLGAGTIGNFVSQFAQARGARKVLICDISDFRISVAKECGIEYASNPLRESLAKAYSRVFGEEGFDIAFEAVGVEETMDAAIQNINKGGEIIVLGVFGERPRIDMSVLGDRELKLTGSLMYKHDDYEEAVNYISSGKIKTGPLVTKHVPFSRYDEAYKFIQKQGDKTMKVMINL
ncbi:zinc-binding dehydrogenase [Bacteroidota bacterium]